ncbi:Spc98 family-domain-containing protein [Syncephalis pseudoplumigaleata]|uniref:Spc98 family-domain-containing protein n=1 Tax=Syncephalis pseudoplumigaleata TaxID=1712513 RepID=A0A4P9Z1E2_9FUNG|nr:Spc98 family-domain-containing protein [Syncephalis pseudoplumigaleata]|eukprot:RKP25210.1 Spc98 family-domain-containing protein [Syncephalis pseudoplumigaleata]
MRQNKSSAKVLQLSTLLNQLSKQTALSNTWAILYLLYAASDLTGGYGHADTPGFIYASRQWHQRLAPPPHPRHELSEMAVLRDVLYAFQGIDGSHIKYNPKLRAYAIESNLTASRSVHRLVHQITELGMLYTNIRNFIETKTNDVHYGLVGQSFCSAMQRQLSEYFRFLAILDAHIPKDAADANEPAPSGALTLRSIVIWTQDFVRKLRLMNVMVDCGVDQKGGALVSQIHAYSNHGDPFIRQFVGETLEEVSRPFYEMLQRWIYEGELEDPHQEFFVACNEAAADEEGEIDIWRDRYTIRTSMIPEFINHSLAHKIYSVGKSLNFIRYRCNDSEWVTERQQDTRSRLETSIDTVYRATSRRLLDTLYTRYRVIDHMQAIKRFLLLGQGEFVQHLMDALGPSLSKPASMVFRHNLTSTLETAIRSSNVQYEDPDIKRRLDVKALEVSPGDSGWDVFSLEYTVEQPITTVFKRSAMNQYRQLFQFLWKLKRVEHTLSKAWHRQMTSVHTLRQAAALEKELRYCNIQCSEMVHFIYQLQYYILFEVLECSWEELHKFIREKADDLDLLIQAHDRYLLNITNKALLAVSPARDQIYSEAWTAIKRRRAVRQTAIERTSRGQWGIQPEDEADDDAIPTFMAVQLPPLRQALDKVMHEYKTQTTALIGMLADHPDMNFKSLAFRLDFNEHYRKSTSHRSHR